MTISASRKDLASAAMFLAIGSYFTLEALNYDIGTPFRMGPGFMPVALGGVLIVLGLIVALTAFRGPDTDEPTPFPWRGLVLILGTIVFFGATIRGLGFIPVVFLSALATAFSSRANNPIAAVIIAVSLCALCLLIFVVGLGLLVPWFGPWLRF
ncbi:tripartite tricarboxylate transporter TctB family protein [Pelagibacterium luteolum]|uniref:Tripartite tricarboxylate transporter TctB family protein n=1 Tax=Pelagibacterium luteolum TaxID=440168 RepID=A0A1G7XFY4_9HYPH|nr:tripartite tricarboxylate transporter TctB family protein [Pelagibacterium luteolum]SDG83132.1 Tripartite tricarboxylate transporter TctB family protein [Pelagibacterium luteolum]